MGKGDKRTKKGKIHNNSYGNSRGKDNKRQDDKYDKDKVEAEAKAKEE